MQSDFPLLLSASSSEAADTEHSFINNGPTASETSFIVAMIAD